MAFCHRVGDSRSCTALTGTSVDGLVTGIQNFVLVDGQPWAVTGDVNTHGGGALVSGHLWLTINGLGVIGVGDFAYPDALCPKPGGTHCAPYAVGFDSLINIVG